MRYLDSGRVLGNGTPRDAERKIAQGFSGRDALHDGVRPHVAAGESESGKPRRRYRSWKSKTDDQVAAIAQGVIDENKVACRTRLWEVDPGLADRLRERGLWGRVRFHRPPCSIEAEPVQAAERQGAGLEADAPVQDGTPPRAPGQQGTEDGGLAEPWSPDDIIFLAQSAIDDAGITGLAELERLDPELHNLVAGASVGGRLRFHAESIASEEPRADADGMSGDGERKGADSSLLSLGAEQLRKSDLHGKELEDEAAYRLILAECFRIGTGNPYVGSTRGTIPKLQSNMNRKLNSRQHRVFKRCWARMAAEHVILYNGNSSAASISPSACGVRDGKLASALAWAISEQTKIGPEWRSLFRGDT